MEAHAAVAMEQAVALFDQQKYSEAFELFVEVYQQCQDLSERQGIFQILEDAYYLPNREEFRENYESNTALLKKYPYFWNKSFHTFEELSFQLFPISDDHYYCYDRTTDRFYGVYDAKTRYQMRYFFENLDRPLQVIDEDNLYNLAFLNDNVRRSEDFAGDNHIYLCYTSLEPLERLMLTCDLAPVLQQEKFVFLIEKKNWKRYPINFRKKLDIDYSQMTPAPVRIEEVKRICFWYKHAYSGTELCLGVLGAVNEIQMISGYGFDTYSTLDGECLYFSPEFRELLADPKRQYTLKQIVALIESGRCHLHLTDLEQYIVWLQEQCPVSQIYSIKDIFVGYFLFQYDKRKINSRIVPMLLFDPHMWDTSVYSKIVCSFPYHSVLTSMREPIMVFARSYMYGLVGWDQFQTQYILGSDYCHAQFLPSELTACYYSFRFEDMKRKPENVCRALCKHLNVPFEQGMLEVEAPATDKAGNITKGFDQAPLHRDISSVLSEFDQLRLKIFYEPIHKYYAYPGFSSEEYPLTEQIVRELFRYPFRFENTNKQFLGNAAPPDETLHKWLQDTLQRMWLRQPVFPKLIPLEDISDE